MQAYLDRNGELVVEAETETESYALSKWGEDNLQPHHLPVESLDLSIVTDLKCDEEDEEFENNE